MVLIIFTSLNLKYLRSYRFLTNAKIQPGVGSYLSRHFIVQIVIT